MFDSQFSSFIRRALGVAGFVVSSLIVCADPAYVMLTVPAGVQEPSAFKGQLSQSKKFGANILRIDNIQNDNPGFSALVVLSFKDEAASEKWFKAIGGDITAPVVVKKADLRTNAKFYPTSTRPSLYKVNHYKLTDTHARYTKFVEGYITPLMEGQRVTSLMSGYAMFVEREPVGVANSVLIAQYRDNASFAEAAPVKFAVRARLTAEHPTYPDYHKTKAGLRDNVSETIAALVEVR